MDIQQLSNADLNKEIFQLWKFRAFPNKQKKRVKDYLLTVIRSHLSLSYVGTHNALREAANLMPSIRYYIDLVEKLDNAMSTINDDMKAAFNEYSERYNTGYITDDEDEWF